MDIEFDRNTFKNLVHFVCSQCSDTALLGATKLNKILWLSDLMVYLNTGKSLTGETYLKRQFGPVPSSILSVLEELQDEGKILVRESTHYGRPKREYIVLEDADSDWLLGENRRWVEEIIDDVCTNHTASSISDFSHTQIYDAARAGEEIPHYAMFMANSGVIEEADLEWAKESLQSALAA